MLRVCVCRDLSREQSCLFPATNSKATSPRARAPLPQVVRVCGRTPCVQCRPRRARASVAKGHHLSTDGVTVRSLTNASDRLRHSCDTCDQRRTPKDTGLTSPDQTAIATVFSLQTTVRCKIMHTGTHFSVLYITLMLYSGFKYPVPVLILSNIHNMEHGTSLMARTSSRSFMLTLIVSTSKRVAVGCRRYFFFTTDK